MKAKRILNAFALLALSGSLITAAPLGTAFTYQGKLADGSNPAQGIYDLRFAIYDVASGGSAVAGPLTNSATGVTNGLFTVTLDFGAVFTGNARWLEIGVRTNGGGAFATLTPRQPLTPAPYALYAPSAGAAATATTAASANAVAAANVTGTLALNQLPAALVTNNATGVNLSGTFSGNGVAVTNVNSDQLDGQHGAYYQNAASLTNGILSDARLSANVPLLNANQSFTGTNLFGQRVGIGSTNPGQLLQVGDANTPGSQGMIRFGSRSPTNATYRTWDIGVPQTGGDVSGIGYSFVIDDTLLGTDPEFLIHYGTGRVGIGRTNPATALDVNGTVTATGFAGNASGLTNLNASQLTGGAVPLALLPGAVVTNNETGLTLSGTFSGNGEGVTNVNLVTANSQGAIGWMTNWGSFVPAAPPGAGGAAWSVAAADVNGDGKVDLIGVIRNGNALTVLTNNGSGGFSLVSTLTVGSMPNSVAAADVNGDGKVDLISANSGTNTLTVLTNNGSGGFVIASSPTVGNHPYAVAAADVNGDGKADLISANFSASTLTVLTNNGTGVFGWAATLPVGPNPDALTAADVNGDGKVDLISANQGGATLTVLTNNGSGGFGWAATLNVGASPMAVTAADVNGDGKVDLISANYSANSLTVLTNNGSGVFGWAATLPVGANPNSVTAADVNGDGKVDLICANNGGNSLSVLTNNGSGGFVLAATLGAVSSPSSVIAADVNGDGHPDLVAGNYSANTLSVLINTPSYEGSFQGSFTGDGSGITSLDASQLATGTVPLTRLPGAVLTNNATGVTLAGTFTGNGSGLTNLNAVSLTGTIADGQLSANVALLNTNQVFTGSNRFAGVVTLTNAVNTLAGTFTGTSAGTFTGNGAALTNVPGALAWQTVSGTSQTASPNAAYLLTNSAQVTVTLPASPNLGDVIRVSAAGVGGWRIAQNDGQIILVRNLPGIAVGANWTARESSRNWTSVASSADGTKLVATAYSGQIWTSTDSGASWTARESNRNWNSAASSADGTKLVAVVYTSSGQIYTSTDSGASWTGRGTYLYWVSVASSADGTKLVAAPSPGNIYTSSDSGTNWTARASSASWKSVASSADGTKLVAVLNGGQISTSSDSGTNWTAHASSLNWQAVASSADGTKLVAVVYGGQIWTSSDSGTNWTAHASSQNWAAVTSSADGTKLVAAVGTPSATGQIYTSSDSGASWTACASSQHWSSVASSADGIKLAAAVYGGQIYTSIPGTTLGASGYLTGGQYTAVELQYIGNGQFVPLSHEGTILAY
jgi:FG-GAP-like repeat